MSRAIVVATLLLAFAGCGERASEEQAPGREPSAASVTVGFAGSEQARIDTSNPHHTCLFYEHYIVVTSEDSVASGEEIRVARLRDGESPATACGRALSRADLTIDNDDANAFAGLHGDHLFIDEGTGPEPRSLLIYDIPSRKIVYSASYSPPISIEQGRLTFFKALNEPVRGVPCASANEWKAAGSSIGYERRVHVELGTMREVATDSVRCVARPL
jgi:hypothetical protein